MNELQQRKVRALTRTHTKRSGEQTVTTHEKQNGVIVEVRDEIANRAIALALIRTDGQLLWDRPLRFNRRRGLAR